MPPLLDDTKGLVVEKGSLECVQLNQNVTLKFRWAIIDTVKVPPNNEREVIHRLRFNKEGTFFKVVEAPGVTYSTWISKQKAEPVRKGNLEIGGTVKSLPSEEVLEVGLQQSVEVYDANGKLIVNGYQRGGSSAQFKRVAVFY
jgi:hypothetical protein